MQTFHSSFQRQGASVDGFLVGELDVAVRDDLAAAVAALAIQPDDVVRLNLAELSFIDSTGLHCLVELQHETVKAGARLQLVDPSPPVVRVLELSGLTEAFDVVPRTIDA